MPDRDNPVDTWTLATDEEGDLRINQMKTLATTHGFNALEQDSKVAVATVRGEDPIDEGFGLDVFTATRSIPHLKREIRRTLLYDDYRHDRVAAVPDITVHRRPNREALVVAEIQYDSGGNDTLQFSITGIIG